MESLPPPVGQIEKGNTGTTLEKEISTNGSMEGAVEGRITKAQKNTKWTTAEYSETM